MTTRTGVFALLMALGCDEATGPHRGKKIESNIVTVAQDFAQNPATAARRYQKSVVTMHATVMAVQSSSTIALMAGSMIARATVLPSEAKKVAKLKANESQVDVICQLVAAKENSGAYIVTLEGCAIE